MKKNFYRSVPGRVRVVSQVAAFHTTDDITFYVCDKDLTRT